MGYLTLTGAETNNNVIAIAGKSANDLTTPAILYPRVLAIVGSGTLSAGSAGGGTLGTLLAYDVTGCFIRTTGGTGGGGTGGANNQARKIVTYNTSTGAFTVSPNWETTPSTDTTYDVLLPEGVTLGMLKTLNPTTAGNTLDVALTGEAGLDFNNIKDASGSHTLTNIVVPTVTTVTNQLTGAAIATAVWTDTTAGDFTTSLSIGKSIMNGVSLGTGLTVARCTLVDTVTTVTNQLTAAQIATGVWQDTTSGDFTVASSIGKCLYIANVAPGAAGGHFIAGSNATTTVNFTGNLSGSVGSVTGAVGSVTGNVGGTINGLTATAKTNVGSAVWDSLLSTYVIAGSMGDTLFSIFGMVAQLDDIDSRIPDVLVSGNIKANAEVVSDKTGYALTSTYDAAKTAAQAGDAMALTAAYDAAKTAASSTLVFNSTATLGTLLATIKRWIQLIFRKDPAIKTDYSADMAEINADEGSGAGSFDNTTDSTQAIADNAGGGGGNYLFTGTVVSTTGTTTTVDSGTPATADQNIGDILVITAGTGAGQDVVITSMNSSRVLGHAAWVVNPDNTSTYEIRAAKSSATVTGGGDANEATSQKILAAVIAQGNE